MPLTSAEIEEIAIGNYSFDFLQIELVQMKQDSPVKYSGSGSVTYSESGTLLLKMYHLYSDAGQAVTDFANSFGKSHTPGKIISKENYFLMQATDVRGNEWHADYLWISGPISMPAIGRVITANIKSMSIKRKVETSESLNLFVVAHGKMNFPWNAYEDSNGNFSLSKYEAKKDNLSWTVRKAENGALYITSTLEGKYCNEISANLFLESIGIAIGHYIRPVLRIEVINDQRTVTVYSRNKFLETKLLVPPFPARMPHHSVHLSSFVECYMNSFSEANSEFFGYWYRVLDATNSEIENNALVVTTAIEGILKRYFENYGLPDTQFTEEAHLARPIIKILEIGRRIKDRLLSSIGQANGFTPKNALYNLKIEGLISGEMIEAWSDLRNKSVHAAQLKRNDIETQLILDQIYTCIGIFFTLLFSKVKYTGPCFSYIEEGWPEKHTVFGKITDAELSQTTSEI